MKFSIGTSLGPVRASQSLGVPKPPRDTGQIKAIGVIASGKHSDAMGAMVLFYGGVGVWIWLLATIGVPWIAAVGIGLVLFVVGALSLGIYQGVREQRAHRNQPVAKPEPRLRDLWAEIDERTQARVTATGGWEMPPGADLTDPAVWLAAATRQATR